MNDDDYSGLPSKLTDYSNAGRVLRAQRSAPKPIPPLVARRQVVDEPEQPEEPFRSGRRGSESRSERRARGRERTFLGCRMNRRGGGDE
ncbi:MAG: hypothetical protein WC655_19240 [Candidatus Hydrogenedentales bacterium]|jgi:hypothetical protein